MIKKRCVILDHAYHAKTESSAFFVTMLKGHFDVAVVHMEDFSEETLNGLLKDTCEVFVAWQLDFIVPFLISNRRKVISVPMFDQSGDLPYVHWEGQKGALIVSFSINLGRKLKMWQIPCEIVQFYPEAASERAHFDDGLRLFFWERVPSQGLDVDWVSTIARSMWIRPTYVHIHNWVDPDEIPSSSVDVIERAFPYATISVSSYFEAAEDYLRVLKTCNVFVAPRLREGIGMAFLEAMSLGMGVIAANQGTMDEYILHEYNGILVEHNRPVVNINTLREWQTIGDEAWQSVQKGRQKWLVDQDRVVGAIMRYVDKYTEWPTKTMSARQAASLAHMFLSNRNLYIFRLGYWTHSWRMKLLSGNTLYNMTWRLRERWPLLLEIVWETIISVRSILRRIL